MDLRRQQQEEESDAQRAQSMILANQHPGVASAGSDKKVDKWCGKRKLLVLQLGRADGKTGRVDQELHGFGLGAAMHVLSVALSYGIRHNRTLLLPDKDSWWYTDPALCKSRSFSCFFEPVSPCSTDRHVGGETMQDLTEDSERPRRGARARVVVAPTRLDKYLNHEDNRCVNLHPHVIAFAQGFISQPSMTRHCLLCADRNCPLFAERLWVPPEFAQRGALWWRAQLVKCACWLTVLPGVCIGESLRRMACSLTWVAQVLLRSKRRHATRT